jgi:hypothetical protein
LSKSMTHNVIAEAQENWWFIDISKEKANFN